MLDKAIEIEGLLRVIRDGNPLPETYKLLMEKTGSLASEATSLLAESSPLPNEEESSIEEKPDADFVMASPETSPEPPKVDFTAPEAPKELSTKIQVESSEEAPLASADHMDIELDLEDEDDIILSFDDPSESTIGAEDIISIDASERIANDVYAREEDIATEVSAPFEESATTVETTSKQDTPIQESSEKKPTPKRQVKLRSVFSLNDRFLYARELFNGNMKMFDSTLDFLEGIDDFSIVEEYFFNELDWNPEDDNVKSFIERLEGVF